MFRLQKGRSKIVSQTRCGLPQNIEKIESIKESTKESSNKNDSSNLLNPEEYGNIPRPVFQKPKGEPSNITSTVLNHDAVLTPQHEEIIRYIKDSWNILVAKDLNDSSSSSTSSFLNTVNEETEQLSDDAKNNYSISVDNIIANTPADFAVVWVEPPGLELEDFKPFDLESFWSQRLFDNITQNL